MIAILGSKTKLRHFGHVDVTIILTPFTYHKTILDFQDTRYGRTQILSFYFLKIQEISIISMLTTLQTLPKHNFKLYVRPPGENHSTSLSLTFQVHECQENTDEISIVSFYLI